MPYWRLFFHIVWATKHRAPAITPEIEAVLLPVIAEKARELDVIVYALNGTEDHVHLAVAIPPLYALTDIIGQLKGRSSYVANHQLGIKFEWQSGYSAHTFGEKHLPWVMQYIEQQKEHHAANTVLMQLEPRDDENNGPAGIAPDR